MQTLCLSALHHRSPLQVGFGILMDLKAVATAIGGEGAGCVSVVQPYIDIKTLHRQLSASSAPGIGKVIHLHCHTSSTVDLD